MSTDYIIIQAGGKGTRMGSLTQNKPKALIPISNKPMIFHLFDMFPDKKFIIIGDYKYSVLEKYLNAFAQVDFQTVFAGGATGTCSGLQKAMSYIPDNEKFMLIWSDLVLPDDYNIPEGEDNYIGISSDFPCRWRYKNNILEEKESVNHGVAGLFIFKDKSYLSNVPESGEFVRWLSNTNIPFTPDYLKGTKEYGLLKNYPKNIPGRCRPFNSLEISGNVAKKIPLNKTGEELAVRESKWYKKAEALGFASIPEIYDYQPIQMEYIKGKNVFELCDISFEDKCNIFEKILDSLNYMHSLESVAYCDKSYYDNYIGKTFDRIEKVRDLIPFANDETITINGRECKNVFYHRDELEKIVMTYKPKEFKFIHGDCTFSNIIIDENNNPVFIDPRGYFGKTEYYGDEAYDWAKLYYSFFTNYDQFNMRNFSLSINDSEVELHIESNQWEALEEYFFDFIGNENKEQIKLLVSIIWLSLTTYAWEDYDSVCAAFYNGLYYLEEVL